MLAWSCTPSFSLIDSFVCPECVHAFARRISQPVGDASANLVAGELRIFSRRHLVFETHNLVVRIRSQLGLLVTVACVVKIGGFD